MSNYSRTNKSNGSKQWISGEVILDSEHDAEWDGFLNDYNGNIDDRNMAETAGQLVKAAKVRSHADTDADFTGSTDAGDTFAGTRPLSLAGDLEAIRYRQLQNVGGENFKGTNSVGTITDLSWLEPGVVGPNLLRNSGFELQTGGAGTAPNDWGLVGLPATCVIEAASELDEGSKKRSINIISGTTGNEGLQQIVQGLKADTLYVIGCAYVRTAGSGAFNISVTGGVSSGTHQNISAGESTSTTLQTYNYVVKTDSSGSSLTVNFFVSGLIGAEVNIYRAWVKEMGDRTTYEDVPHIPTHYVASTTALGPWAGSVGGGWDELEYTPVALSQYVPTPGYEVEYKANLSVDDAIEPGALHNNWRLVLEMDVDGGGYNAVKTHVGYNGYYAGGAGITIGFSTPVEIRYLVPSPVPGSTYSFRVMLGSYDGFQTGINGQETTTTHHAELRMRRV